MARIVLSLGENSYGTRQHKYVLPDVPNDKVADLVLLLSKTREIEERHQRNYSSTCYVTQPSMGLGVHVLNEDSLVVNAKQFEADEAEYAAAQAKKKAAAAAKAEE